MQVKISPIQTLQWKQFTFALNVPFVSNFYHTFSMEGKQGVNNSLNLKSMKFQKALLIVLIDNQWQPKHLTKKKKKVI